MSKTAILLGATGLVGGYLLERLLKDDCYTKVKVFGRSSCNKSHKKLEEYIGDLFQLESFAEEFTGDVVFCCIGTTKAKTPDKKKYRKIDHGIPVAAATLALQNGIRVFEVISSMGANVDSSTFYNKVKGEMERDVIAVGVRDTYIFQPSLLGGSRNDTRLGEQLAQFFMATFSFFVPKRYKIIQPETVARAMIKVAEGSYKQQRIPSDTIKEIADD